MSVTAIDMPCVTMQLDAIIDQLCVLRALFDAHNTVDDGVMMVARAIQGEEAGLFGTRRDELGRWIAHVAYNRYEKPWWRLMDGVPITFAERTEIDFHGVALVDDPEPWAIRLAHEVITARREGDGDATGGCLFMLSLDDLTGRDWMDRAERLVQHVISAPDDPLVQFWCFRLYPGDGE